MDQPQHHEPTWRETALTFAGSLAALGLLIVIGNQVPDFLLSLTR
jgi:hypothetical protein